MSIPTSMVQRCIQGYRDRLMHSINCTVAIHAKSGGVPGFFLLRSIPLALRYFGIDGGKTAYLLSRETTSNIYPGHIFGTRANWPAIDLGGTEDYYPGYQSTRRRALSSTHKTNIYPVYFRGDAHSRHRLRKQRAHSRQRTLWYRAAFSTASQPLALLLFKYQDGRDIQSRSIWLRHSGRWLTCPGGDIFYGHSAFRSTPENR